MAKLSLVNREKKRQALVKKFHDKRVGLQKIIKDSSKSEDERYEARLALQLLPRNSSPTRLRSRCELTGRPEALTNCLVLVVGNFVKLRSKGKSLA